MPDKTIKVPIFGNQPRGAVLAGGFAVVAVGGYLIYKHYMKPKTTAGAAAYGYGAAAAYGYGTTVPYSPEYGYGMYGYGGYSPYGTYGFGGGGYFGRGFGYGYGGGGGGGGQQPITTNAQWSQAVNSQLKASGYNEIAILTALGKYLTGRALDNQQQHIIEAAIALEGDPPVSGPNGYPPKVKISPRQPHKRRRRRGSNPRVNPGGVLVGGNGSNPNPGGGLQ